jgi:23S rRNA (adenine2503-C2)-methyltransferase
LRLCYGTLVVALPLPQCASLFNLAPKRLACALEATGVAPHAAMVSVGNLYRALRVVLRPRALADCASAPAWSDAHFASLRIARQAWPLLGSYSLDPTLTLEEIAPAADGPLRLLWRTTDAQLVESVLIPSENQHLAGRTRTTLCVSSQVGCARACTFCETGLLGLQRQLAVAEIIDQVRLSIQVALEHNLPAPDNLVFMGMGEPLDNFEAVRDAILLLTEKTAFGFAPAKITVSTVGIPDLFARFFAEVPAALAVSLSAPDNLRRARIMPVARRYSLQETLAALRASLPSNQKVLFAYVLFADFNDSPADAVALAELVADIPCRVNVIPFNGGPDPELQRPTEERQQIFVDTLRNAGVVTLVRRSRGRGVGGACGQLAGARRRMSSTELLDAQRLRGSRHKQRHRSEVP